MDLAFILYGTNLDTIFQINPILKFGVFWLTLILTYSHLLLFIPKNV